jgi:catechol 2,3-dioxygenase-like lactoylglutathione lyase family enzyme
LDPLSKNDIKDDERRHRMGRPGLPGLRGVDHIGFTVPDLDEATRFLVDVLGCEYLYSLGPFEHRDDDWMLEHLNVHPRATVPENRFFRCGGQAIFEVFAYTAPERNLEPPRNSDVGGHHVALYVEDLEVAVQHLREAGVNVLGEPTASSGAHLGQRWVYFLAPWGMQFELVSYPQGKAWFNEAANAAASADLAVPAGLP